MIDTTDLNNWEKLYDKYSPVLFAVIMRHTDNKIDAENILIEVFTQLNKNPGLFLQTSPVLMVSLIRFTQMQTINYLKKANKQVAAYTDSGSHAPVLHACLFSQQNLPAFDQQKGNAAIDIRKNLFKEFRQLRHHPVNNNTL